LTIHLICAFHPAIPEHTDKNRLHIIEKPFSHQQLNDLDL
jgi:hypothetical protein